VQPLQSGIDLKEALAVEGPDLKAFTDEGEDEAVDGHVVASLLTR
jgi:hypothetical protein